MITNCVGALSECVAATVSSRALVDVDATSESSPCETGGAVSTGSAADSVKTRRMCVAGSVAGGALVDVYLTLRASEATGTEARVRGGARPCQSAHAGRVVLTGVGKTGVDWVACEAGYCIVAGKLASGVVWCGAFVDIGTCKRRIVGISGRAVSATVPAGRVDTGAEHAA